MSLSFFKRNFLTMSLASASLFFAPKDAEAQHGIRNPRPVERIVTPPSDNSRGELGKVRVQELSDNPEWAPVWENNGYYMRRLADVPYYKDYIKKNLFLTRAKEVTRPGGHLALDKVHANPRLQQMAFESIRFESGKGDVRHIVIYEDSNGDMEIDPKVDKKISEVLIINTPYISPEDRQSRNRNAEVLNRLSYMAIEADKPDVIIFGDFIQDRDENIVPSNEIANRTVPIRYDSVKAVEKFFAQNKERASYFDVNGPAKVIYAISGMIETAFDIARAQVPPENIKRFNQNGEAVARQGNIVSDNGAPVTQAPVTQKPVLQ